MRHLHRTLVALLLGACTLGLTAVAPAGAAVTVGPTETPEVATTQRINFPSPSILFNLRGEPGQPVLSQASGVVTRWRVWTGTVDEGALYQLRILRPMGSTDYTVSRSGPVELLHADSGQLVLHEFPARVPIVAGETPGLEIIRPTGQTATIALPIKPPESPWAYGYGLGEQPPDGGSFTAAFYDQTNPMGSDQYVAMNVDVEPDADGDTFGDETQDLCPADASTQGACPPGPDVADPHVALAGVPASMPIGTFLKGVKAKLTPDEAVALSGQLLATARTARISAFNLQLATKSAGLAAGPRTLKLKPSRKLVGHPRKRFRVRLRITATDAAGNATTITKTFRVQPRR